MCFLCGAPLRAVLKSRLSTSKTSNIIYDVKKSTYFTFYVVGYSTRQAILYGKRQYKKQLQKCGEKLFMGWRKKNKNSGEYAGVDPGVFCHPSRRTTAQREVEVRHCRKWNNRVRLPVFQRKIRTRLDLPSEHPPVRAGKMSKRSGGIKEGCQSCSWSTEQGKLIFPSPRLRLGIWSRDTGSFSTVYLLTSTSQIECAERHRLDNGEPSPYSSDAHHTQSVSA